MKTGRRIIEISYGLGMGAETSLKVTKRLHMIGLELNIQAAYIDDPEEAKKAKFTGKKLSEDVDTLGLKIIKVGELGALMGQVFMGINENNAHEITERIDEISKQLWSDSVGIFMFLENLKLVCLNLTIQMKKVGDIPAARAIDVIVTYLTREIELLQNSAKMVRDASKEVGKVNNDVRSEFGIVKETEKIKVKVDK